MKRLLCVLSFLCVLCVEVFISAQAPARETPGATLGTATLRGRVVAAENGAPLKRAKVRLNEGSPNDATVLTDENGRYEFSELPTGRFTLSAAKSGYVTLSFGQRRPSEMGRTVDIASGQRLDAIDFALPKG